MDAGIGHDAGGRHQGPLSAPPARPRQAGLDRGQRGRASASSTKRSRITILSKAMFEANARSPSIPCYLICDAAFIEKYGLGVVYPGAGNLSALAQVGIPQARRYAGQSRCARLALTRQGCARRSRAMTALRKPASISTSARAKPSSIASTAMNRTKPNPCIGPLATAPFYGCRNLARRNRGQHRPVHGCRRARAGPGSSGHSRPVCLRQRYGVDRCRVHIQARAPRSVPEWSLPIARRCMPPASRRWKKNFNNASRDRCRLGVRSRVSSASFRFAACRTAPGKRQSAFANLQE